MEWSHIQERSGTGEAKSELGMRIQKQQTKERVLAKWGSFLACPETRATSGPTSPCCPLPGHWHQQAHWPRRRHGAAIVVSCPAGGEESNGPWSCPPLQTQWSCPGSHQGSHRSSLRQRGVQQPGTRKDPVQLQDRPDSWPQQDI